MGSDPPATCAVDSSNMTRFLVQFGNNPIVKTGDIILLYGEQLRYQKFNKFFAAFMRTQVYDAFSPMTPKGKLLGPKMNVTLCEEVTINFTEPQFDGRRKLKILKWEMPSLIQLSTQKLKDWLTNLMNDAVTKQSFQLKIPILTLEPFFNYTFRIKVENFQGRSGFAEYEFLSSTVEAPKIRIDKTQPFVFYPQEQINLYADIRHYLCSDTETFEVHDKLNCSWQQLNGTPALFNTPFTFEKQAL